jgi:hypothetical protein
MPKDNLIFIINLSEWNEKRNFYFSAVVSVAAAAGNSAGGSACKAFCCSLALQQVRCAEMVLSVSPICVKTNEAITSSWSFKCDAMTDDNAAMASDSEQESIADSSFPQQTPTISAYERSLFPATRRYFGIVTAHWLCYNTD